MARELISTEHRTTGSIPIRWSAPEVLKEGMLLIYPENRQLTSLGVYSIKSDVWAFAGFPSPYCFKSKFCCGKYSMMEVFRFRT